MIYYFISYHGRFLARDADSGEPTQVALADIRDRSLLISAKFDDDFRPGYAGFIQKTPGAAVPRVLPGLDEQMVRFDPATRTVSLARDALILCALSDGRLEQTRIWVRDWERFVICSDIDLDVLQLIATQDWIVKSSRLPVRAEDIRLGPGHTLRIGDLKIPLAFNLPLEMPGWPFGFTALVDGWRIEELLVFRPLICFAALGADDVFAQLYISLESLLRFGGYSGTILLLTDRPAEQIRANIPEIAPEQLLIRQIRAGDRIGYKAAKYRLLDQPDAYGFQPVAVMDVDIVFNTDANVFLIPMAVAGRLTAPIEAFSELATSPSVGSTLLQMDHCAPRFGCGFNAGTIGIPNLPEHGHTVALIRRVIENFITLNYRRDFSWIDQPAANYVSYKVAHFDTNELSRCVRYGTYDDAKRPGPSTGLVHFWMIPAADRTDIMAAYRDLLPDG